jgi:Predicted kinase related to dihydroxyacetone kinase
MDGKTFEQIELPKANLQNEIPYLAPNGEVIIVSYNDEILGIQLPAKVALTVTECEPAVKGDTINSAMDGTVVAAKAKIIDTVAALLKSISGIDDKEVLTVFYGIDAKEEDKENLKAFVGEKYPMMEVVEIEGKQTIYPFVFAVE